MDALNLKGDAKVTLQALSEALGSYETSEVYQNTLIEYKKQWNQEVEHLYNISSKTDKLNQVQILGILNKFMCEDDIIISAAGSLPGDLHRVWRSQKPKDYHVEYGFSCMGYEVAAGLGVTLAQEYNDLPGEAYVVVGDGSYLMLHSEIVTAIQENKKFTIILIDNSGFHCINNLQCSHGSQGFCTELRFRNDQGKYGGSTLPINFGQYAAALGAKSYKVNTLLEFKEALCNAKKQKKVTLIEVKSEPKTMTDGYESWWRVDVAETSKSQDVSSSYKKMKYEKIRARKY
jgi:3D-(3,5/4)-trihydroxycyclohexane-1,2-dione acylhydrolase (decyclizing)